MENLKIGDKVKVIKRYGIQEGDIYLVTGNNSDELSLTSIDGSIDIMFSSETAPIYFEKLKRNWTDWKENDLLIPRNAYCSGCPFWEFCQINEKNRCKETLDVEYRHNSKVVEVRKGELRTSASCCPRDEYDVKTGFLIACKRLCSKLLANEVQKRVNKYIDDLTGGEEAW